LLTRNLRNNGSTEELASKALKALAKAAAMVAPSGKQNSYANRTQAFYVLAEKGDAQPRNLSLAFLKEGSPDDPLEAIKRLRSMKDKFDAAYTAPKYEQEMNIFEGGKLSGVLAFIGDYK